MLKVLNTFSLVCCLFVFSGCGLFRNLKKTKTETTTTIKIDTLVSILPDKETTKEIYLTEFLNFDTLKIETQRNEILVFVENVPRGTIPKVKLINKEKEFKQPIQIQTTTTTKETVKEKTETSILKKMSKYVDIIFYTALGTFFVYCFIMLFKNLD